MKRWIIFGFILALACQRVPTGPNLSVSPDPTVTIEHTATEYVTATQPTAGILADKANVLFFQIRVSNVSAKSVEFLGYATIEGPPDNHQQIVHFWTDSVGVKPQGVGFDQNTYQELQPDSTYLLVRTKYPTNDYFPFSGTQGKILQVVWTEAWASDQSGRRFSIKLDSK
jgi:hypothetical protein